MRRADARSPRMHTEHAAPSWTRCGRPLRLVHSFERLFLTLSVRRREREIVEYFCSFAESVLFSFSLFLSIYLFKDLSSYFTKFRVYILANILVTSTILVGLEFLIGRDNSKEHSSTSALLRNFVVRRAAPAHLHVNRDLITITD